MFLSAVAFSVLVLPPSIADDGPTPADRARAEKLMKDISDPDLRWRALTLLKPAPATFDATLELIGGVRPAATRIQLLRKFAHSPKYKSLFARSLTTEEIAKLHKCIAVESDKHSGAGVLGLIYLNASLDRTRAGQAVKLLENVPSGDWKDTVCLGAIYSLTTRRHVTDALRGQKLPMDAKSVPESFLTDSQQILSKIRNRRFREAGSALIALSTLHRGHVDKSLEYLEHIRLPQLRDVVQFQAVSVLLTRKLDREQSVSFELTPDETRRFGLAAGQTKSKK